MTPLTILAWWNLVFAVPFAFGFLFLLLQCLGLLGDDMQLDGEAPAEIEADAGLEADTDADVETDLEVDGEVEGDTMAEVGTESGFHGLGKEIATGAEHLVEVSVGVRYLRYLGVGKLPLSFLAMMFCFGWGIAGVGLNLLLAPFLAEPFLFFPLSFLGAILLCSVSLHHLAGLLAGFMPSISTTASKAEQLVGCVGKAVHAIHPGRVGAVRLTDRNGNPVQCTVRLAGERGLEAGAAVFLFGWDPERKTYEGEPAAVELIGSPEEES